MTFLRKENGEFNGSVGEGRDNVPGPADIPVLDPFTATNSTMVLSETLLRLRGVSEEFSTVSERYEQAWREYVTEEVTRNDPQATALLVDMDKDGHLLVGVLYPDGHMGRIEDLPNGERLVAIVAEYFAACLPQYGINLTNGEPLRDGTDLRTLGGGVHRLYG